MLALVAKNISIKYRKSDKLIYILRDIRMKFEILTKLNAMELLSIHENFHHAIF